jgi:hypothetical protein
MAAPDLVPRPADPALLREIAASRDPVVDAERNADRLRELATILEALRDGFDELTDNGDSRKMIAALVELFDGE